MDKVTIIEMFHKSKDLKIHKLISDLQGFEIHHLLPKKGKVSTNKGKSFALKSTKSSNNKEKITSVTKDDNSSLD